MPILNLRMPITIKLIKKLASGGSKVASGGSIVASGGSVLGVIFGPEKKAHKKLVIRKKSTILGFLPSNFTTKLVWSISLQETKNG